MRSTGVLTVVSALAVIPMFGCGGAAPTNPHPAAPVRAASPLTDLCIPTPPGSQAPCEPQPEHFPRWRKSCAAGLPADDEIEIELTHTGSMRCWDGRVVAAGPLAAPRIAAHDNACISVSGDDRWPHFRRGTIVYLVPIFVDGSDGSKVEGQITCYLSAPAKFPPVDSDDAATLLDELCLKLEVCLTDEHRERLVRDPPTNVDAFLRAVFAQGLQREQADRALVGKVRAMVTAAFQRGR